MIKVIDSTKSFTWAQFTLPLSTGGVALVLSATPHRFDGLNTIGKIFFIFALVIFIISVTAITLRFVLFPGTFKQSLVHPTEALFTPTFLLSCMSFDLIFQESYRVIDCPYSCHSHLLCPSVRRTFMRALVDDHDRSTVLDLRRSRVLERCLSILVPLCRASFDDSEHDTSMDSARFPDYVECNYCHPGQPVAFAV